MLLHRFSLLFHRFSLLFSPIFTAFSFIFMAFSLIFIDFSSISKLFQRFSPIFNLTLSTTRQVGQEDHRLVRRREAHLKLIPPKNSVFLQGRGVDFSQHRFSWLVHRFSLLFHGIGTPTPFIITCDFAILYNTKRCLVLYMIAES